MTEELVTLKKLSGARIKGGRFLMHKVGNIEEVVFHPTEKRVVGFICRRPDLLWMIKHKDRFVALLSVDILEKRLYAQKGKPFMERAAYKGLGLDPNECVAWVDLPVLTKSGHSFGVVVNVTFDFLSGDVRSIEVGSSSFDSVMFGKQTIPVELIKGYRSREAALTALGKPQAQGEVSDGRQPVPVKSFVGSDEVDDGIILVSEKAVEIRVEDGLTKKAGKAASVVKKKASKTGEKISINAKAAAAVTETIITDGAIATGKQIQKTRGMFSAFRDEYKKARRG
ncbi:MAG: PRC-barrel domain-containing protein [Coriobacteriia bacterium]|nr:PRC-barrel domain-containing protein [Coriobacteriia bacterium]